MAPYFSSLESVCLFFIKIEVNFDTKALAKYIVVHLIKGGASDNWVSNSLTLKLGV